MSSESSKSRTEMPTLATLPDNRDALLAEFVLEGGNPNQFSLQQGEIKARQKAYAENVAEKKRHQQERGRFSRWASTAVNSGLEFVAVLFTLLLVLFGLLLGTSLLIAAEVAAVEKGFGVIDDNFATLYAIATVFFFIVTLFIREVVARDATSEPEIALSLRTTLNELIYFLGLNRTWQPVYKRRTSLLVRVDGAVRWLMWTIVVFGLMGRLDNKLGQIEGDWYTGIKYVLTSSSLKDMLAYLGSLVMTVALLLATHYIVYFVHQVYVRVTGGFDARFFVVYEQSLSPDSLAELQAIKFWQIELLKLRTRNQTQPLLEITH